MMAGKRKYFDLRYMFMRGLMSHEQMQRCKSYLKSAAECTSKAIVSLELSDKNINTTKQAMRLELIGVETVRRLEGYIDSKAYSSDQPAPGCFVSSAGAFLVALLNLTETAAENSQSGVALIKEVELRNEAAKLCEEKFLPKDSPGFCQAWWRLEVLIKRDLVKRRSLHKANVYHLLPLGMEAAIALRARSRDQSVPKPAETNPAGKNTARKARKRKAEESPVPELSPSSIRNQVSALDSPVTVYSPSVSGKSVHSSAPSSMTSAPSTEMPQKHVLTDAMYSNDTGADGVVLLVDIQECGGNRSGLAELCEMIEQTGTVYRTKKLPCADYTWMWRRGGIDRYLPVLLERKRADDVAYSLKDGRFWRQICEMSTQKEDFENKGVAATLLYVLEGKPENFVVRCADGCQGVGRCGNPTLTQVKRVLADLQQHPHLELVAMDSILDTVRHLADLTAQLKNRCERGDFDALLVAEMVTTGAKTPAREEKTSASCSIMADDPVFIDDDKDDDLGNVNKQKTPITCSGLLNERFSNRQLPLETNDETPKMSGAQNSDSLEMFDKKKQDFKSLSGKDHLCHKRKVFEEKTWEVGCSVRNSNSVGSVVEDVDDSPPLLLPSLAKARRTNRDEESRLVGHGGREERQIERDGTVINSRPVTPRGRVYLMKYSPVRSGIYPSSTRHSSEHPFPGKRDLTNSALCSSQIKTKGLSISQERHNATDMQQKTALSANMYQSRHNATDMQQNTALSANMYQSNDNCVDSSPGKHSLLWNSPNKHSVTSSALGNSKCAPQCIENDSKSGGLFRTEARNGRQCPYTRHTISVPGDGDYEDADGDDSLPDLQPLQPNCLTFSVSQDTAAVNCSSAAELSYAIHTVRPVSCVSDQSHPCETFDHIIKQGCNAANEAHSSSTVVSAASLRTESSFSNIFTTVSAPSLVTSMATSISRLNSSPSTKAGIFSYTNQSAEMASRKSGQPTQKEDTTVSLVWERLSSVTKPLPDSLDGSDSEDLDSLPDIDLTLPPQRSPSLSSALSIPLQPSHSITHPGETQGREVTPCHQGGNSQEETTAHALSGPKNETTSNEVADKIAHIATVFPQMSRCRIAEVLHDFDDDVERCVIAILEDPGMMGRQEMMTAASVSTTESSMYSQASGGTSSYIDLTD